jgi:hypothetical protein
MNPFPNMPGVTDLGDSRRLVETHDKGHCIRMIESDGKVSMVISMSGPPAPKPVVNEPYHVRSLWCGHEIIDSDGKVLATTTNPNEAALFCKMRNLYEKMRRKKRQAECPAL